MTLVIIMRFRIAAGREGEWEEFVARRSRDAKGQDGFERMYLLKPQSGGNEYRVVSWWTHQDKPEAWIRTETYAYSEDESHQGIVVGPVEHEVLQIVTKF